MKRMLRVGYSFSFSALMCLLLATLLIGCADSANNHTTPVLAGSQSDPSDVQPIVTCDDANVCSIQISVSIAEKKFVSPPLPFQTNSAQLERIAADESFGLGILEKRNVEAWSIGDEEHAVGVAVEVAKLRGAPVIIAHQNGGFEHVKRAHVVLQIAEESLNKHLEFVEDNSPDILKLWPVEDGVVLSRSKPSDASTPVLTHYRIATE